MKIGDVRIRGRLALAPMCGISMLPYRILCRENGAGLVVSEMIDTDRLAHEVICKRSPLDTCQRERPVSAQIFGTDPKNMLKGARKVLERKPDMIDINMGCPSPKIARKGAGASLLSRPGLVEEIVSTLSGSLDCPVTAKIRLGVNSSNDAVRIARTIERAGASAIAVHGRTMEQRYAGSADWDMIRSIKEHVGIPVIGNGDVRCAENAHRMLDITGCDMVMIGRAAIGDPYIFRQCDAMIERGETLPDQTAEEKIQTYKELCRLIDRYGTSKLKDHKIYAYGFTRGFKDGSKLRERISMAKRKEEIDEIFSKYLEMYQ